MNNQAIGFIDSGVGGLSVVREVMRRLPNEDILFVGDTARNPYGEKTTEEVLQFSRELAHFLMKKNIKMLVIACNTATAAAVDILKKELPIPVFGVIEPGSELAVKATKNKEVGVIGTRRTIQSNEHRKKIQDLNSSIKVQTLAVPKFVEIVEDNDLTSDYAKQVIQEELKDFKQTDIDTLILGCTHYPLLADLIQDYLGDDLTLIDPAIPTVDLVEEYLVENNLLKTNSNRASESIFYTTAAVDKFETIARNWIKIGKFKVENIGLEELEK